MGRKSEEHKVEANKIRNSIEEVKRDIGHIESNFSERAKSLNSEKSAEMEKAKYRIPSSVIFTFLGTLILTAVLFFASPILALAAFILGILFAAYKIKTVRGDAKNVREIEKKYDKLMRQTEQEKIGQIRSKEGEMASQSRKLEGISKAHQKALSQVEKEEDKTVEELKNEIESIGKEKGSLSKRLSSDDIERDLSVAERDREGCLKEIKKSEGEMDGVAKRIKENKVRLNKTGNEIKSYEYSIERLNIVAEEILKRVPKWVRMRLISVVREETRNIFLKMFGHRYKDIEITSDYNIEVLSPLAREFYPVSMISGGEDTAANISLRLGISKALYRVYTEVRGANAAPGLLIMDEPTTHLDRRRRELLTEVIRTIKDLPQVIISTNIEEVENAADSIIYVNRISPMSNSNIIVKGK